MSAYFAEFIGTFLLITVGASINANVVLAQTKGHNSGWTVITIGWGLPYSWCIHGYFIGGQRSFESCCKHRPCGFWRIGLGPLGSTSLRSSQALLPGQSWRGWLS